MVANNSKSGVINETKVKVSGINSQLFGNNFNGFFLNVYYLNVKPPILSVPLYTCIS